MRLIWILALLPSVAWAGARVSAFQKESRNGANFWNASSAIDGKMETAWMVPGESDNKGEWIEIDVPRGEIDKIAIFPGFNKSDTSYPDYPRLKKVRIDIFALDDSQEAKQVGTATLDLPDKREMQVFDLPDTKVNDGMFGGRVRMTVVEIYEGEDFPNLGVSEIVVHMKEFDAKVQVSAISAETAGKGKELMLDDNPKTFFSAPAGPLEMTLTSTGFGLSSVGFVPAGKDWARPKTVEISVGNQTLKSVLPDSVNPAAPQVAPIPGFNGYTGGGFGDVTVKILDTYPGAKSPDIGIAELKPKATNFESI